MTEPYVTLEQAIKIIDCEEFYDMLPGNGQDDWICQWLRKAFKEIAKANVASAKGNKK
jgi:hypothetical protein